MSYPSDRRIKRLSLALAMLRHREGSERDDPFPWPNTDPDQPMYDPEHEVYLGFALIDF